MYKPQVFVSNDILVTTSKAIARYFNEPHSYILWLIEQVGVGEGIVLFDGYYQLNREGFLAVCGGFCDNGIAIYLLCF